MTKYGTVYYYLVSPVVRFDTVSNKFYVPKGLLLIDWYGYDLMKKKIPKWSNRCILLTHSYQYSYYLV